MSRLLQLFNASGIYRKYAISIRKEILHSIWRNHAKRPILVVRENFKLDEKLNSTSAREIPSGLKDGKPTSVRKTSQRTDSSRKKKKEGRGSENREALSVPIATDSLPLRNRRGVARSPFRDSPKIVSFPSVAEPREEEDREPITD